MKVFKSKTIDGFTKLNQSQSLAIRGGCCTGNGQQPPPEDPPKSAIATTPINRDLKASISVLGG